MSTYTIYYLKKRYNTVFFALLSEVYVLHIYFKYTKLNILDEYQ